MGTRRTRALALLAAALLPLSGVAQDGSPLSAIDWLSDSVDDSGPPQVADEPPAASLPTEVSVLPLDTPVADAAGLLDAGDLAIDPGLWGRSAASDLARALARVPDTGDGPPAARRFLNRLMLARLTPPIDAAVDDSFFLARLDWLLSHAHLDDARNLIEAADPANPRLFRRLFDIAILKGEVAQVCRQIEETPDLSPTYPARIFCLARLGQWDVAALTLGNAESLGILSDDEEKLLLHFLDPELFEGEPVPAPPLRPTPLEFRLYEAVGERISTDRLPTAFAAADLTDTVGWKTRLRAAERLAAAGAVHIEDLLEVYAERKPAASGGVFDRVGAVMGLARALKARDADETDETLSPAWSAARTAGYAPAFAHWIAPRLDGLKLTGPAAHTGFEIALFAGDQRLARSLANASSQDRFLLALAAGDGGAPPTDPLGRAVLRGLSALRPGETYSVLIEDDRRGEALFRALEQLSGGGAAGNPDATAQSLALLRAIGLDALARQIAVELILMEGAA